MSLTYYIKQKCTPQPPFPLGGRGIHPLAPPPLTPLKQSAHDYRYTVSWQHCKTVQTTIIVEFFNCCLFVIYFRVVQLFIHVYNCVNNNNNTKYWLLFFFLRVVFHNCEMQLQGTSKDGIRRIVVLLYLITQTDTLQASVCLVLYTKKGNSLLPFFSYFSSESTFEMAENVLWWAMNSVVEYFW